MRNKLTPHFRSVKRLRFWAVLLAFSLCMLLTEFVYAKEKQQITGIRIGNATGSSISGLTAFIKETSIVSFPAVDGNKAIRSGTEDVLDFTEMAYLTLEKTIEISLHIDIAPGSNFRRIVPTT
jgi:hypothetical protein